MSERNTERLELRVSPAFLARLDEWRRQQPDLPTRSEAMRRLAEFGVDEYYAPTAAERSAALMTPKMAARSVSKIPDSMLPRSKINHEAVTLRKLPRRSHWEGASLVIDEW